MCGKHGNYQPARSQYAVRNYLQKEDATPLLFGEVLDPASAPANARPASKRSCGKTLHTQDTGNRSKPVAKSLAVAQALLSGRSLWETLQEDPGFYLLNGAKIEQFASTVALFTTTRSLLNWPLSRTSPMPAITTNAPTRVVLDWLTTNLFVERPLRTKHLFVSGPSSTGKTTMVELLKLFCRIYLIPKTEDFYDRYRDDLYDLALLEEFKASKPINWLNEWLGGSSMDLRIKCRPAMIKQKNIATIIIAQHPLDRLYHKALEKDQRSLDALKNRLVMVDLENEPLDIEILATVLNVRDCSVMKDFRDSVLASRQATRDPQGEPGNALGVAAFNSNADTSSHRESLQDGAPAVTDSPTTVITAPTVTPSVSRPTSSRSTIETQGTSSKKSRTARSGADKVAARRSPWELHLASRAVAPQRVLHTGQTCGRCGKDDEICKCDDSL